MNNPKDLGASFEKFKHLEFNSKDEAFVTKVYAFARSMSIDFLKYAINNTSQLAKDDEGYFATVKGQSESISLEELFDNFL